VNRTRQQFLAFHAEHPEVYWRLRALAFQYRRRGFDRVGIATLFEVLRYERDMQGVRDAKGFRLNNNYKAHYARMLMVNNPELDGIFETRNMRAEQVAA
jgi:hypothetical protein